MYKSSLEIAEKLDYILASPKDSGRLELIVARPEVNERIVLEEGELSTENGLLGDNWIKRGSSKTPDGSSHPEMQINIMNVRVIDALTKDKAHWPLAGDQLFADLDLSEENLPAGTKLKIGDAILEVTSIPHNGCGKFKERFGSDALKFVNGKMGKLKHFRGVNARVLQSGRIKSGQTIIKIK